MSIENGNNKPTRILYDTNLSWKILQELLMLLQQKGLIEKRYLLTENYSKNSYYLTQSGEIVLRNLRHLQSTLQIEPVVAIGGSE